MTYDFYEGDFVEKKKGYKFPGIVVGKFRKLNGQTRYAVECTIPEVAGALHIFSGDDLVKKEKQNDRRK